MTPRRSPDKRSMEIIKSDRDATRLGFALGIAGHLGIIAALIIDAPIELRNTAIVFFGGGGLIGGGLVSYSNKIVRLNQASPGTDDEELI